MEQQEYYQQLNNEMQAEIRTELSKVPFPFPDEKGLGDFLFDIDQILKTTSLNELKIDADIHKELINSEFNLFNITFILNAFANKTPNELSASPESYNETIKRAYKLGELHTKHAKPIQERIKAKYQAKAEKWQKDQMIKQSQNQKKENRKVIPLNKK